MESSFFFIFFFAVLAGLIGFLLWRLVFSPRARRRRLLRKFKGVPISQAKDGELVKVVGRLHYAEGETPLRAPLSERFGAYYRVQVEQRRSSGQNSDWKEIINERATHQTIWLQGARPEERALVDLGLADVELVMDARYDSGFLNDPSPRLEAFLADHGYSGEGWVFNKTLRYHEGVLEQGERIAVLGRCVREPDPDPRASAADRGYRDAPTRLRLVSPAEHELLVTDDPKLLA